MPPVKQFVLLFVLFFSVALQAQKHVYNVELFGKIIGSTTVERIDKGSGIVEYKLSSHSEVNILFSKKTSSLVMDVYYKDDKLYSSYVKNVKDDVTEVASIVWDGAKYVIKKGAESLQLSQLVDYSNAMLYFVEPKGRTKVFSERLGQWCNFTNPSPGVYDCKLDNGVDNIYRYRNGVLYELELTKGASVFMKLVQ